MAFCCGGMAGEITGPAVVVGGGWSSEATGVLTPCGGGVVDCGWTGMEAGLRACCG